MLTPYFDPLARFLGLKLCFNFQKKYAKITTIKCSDRFDMIHCLTNDPSLSPNEVFIEDQTPVTQAPPPPPPNAQLSGRECKTRFSFNAEFDGCLTVQKGETLILCRHNNDGWSLGKY